MPLWIENGPPMQVSWTLAVGASEFVQTPGATAVAVLQSQARSRCPRSGENPGRNCTKLFKRFLSWEYVFQALEACCWVLQPALLCPWAANVGMIYTPGAPGIQSEAPQTSRSVTTCVTAS